MYVVRYAFVVARGIGLSCRDSPPRYCKPGVSGGASQLRLICKHTPRTDRGTNASIDQSNEMFRIESSPSLLTAGISPLHVLETFPGHTPCPF